MNPENAINPSIRLSIGLLAGVLAAVSVGLSMEMIGEQIVILASILSALVGFVSTSILKNASPRREKPSMLGAAALMLILACYIVIGLRVVASSSIICIACYIACGAALTWLVFTSIAETPILSAFGIGGLFCGFLGIIVAAAYQEPFNRLFMNVQGSTQGEITWIYAAIALACAIPGAFAAAAGRLSGWGLVEHKTEELWAFTADGRLYTRKDTI